MLFLRASLVTFLLIGFSWCSDFIIFSRFMMSGTLECHFLYASISFEGLDSILHYTVRWPFYMLDGGARREYRGVVYPKDNWHVDILFPRIFGIGVPSFGGVKYPTTSGI